MKFFSFHLLFAVVYNIHVIFIKVEPDLWEKNYAYAKPALI